MMQRLLQSGSRRLQQATSIDCGTLSALDQALRWESVDSDRSKDIRSQAGVYRSGDRLLAVNRPAVEDEPEVLDASQAQPLFGPLTFQMLQDQGAQAGALQGEIWRLFLLGMLLFLVAEGVLILPARSGAAARAPRQPAPAAPVEART
jgi:hypothetical protein